MSYLQLSLLLVVLTGIAVKVAARRCWWRTHACAVLLFAVTGGAADAALAWPNLHVHRSEFNFYVLVGYSPILAAAAAFGIALRVLTTGCQKYSMDLEFVKRGYLPLW